jgi:hypothetical protein
MDESTTTMPTLGMNVNGASMAALIDLVMGQLFRDNTLGKEFSQGLLCALACKRLAPHLVFEAECIRQRTGFRTRQRAHGNQPVSR